MSNARLLCTTQQLASHAGITPQRINQYVALGMPKVGRNRFNLHVCCLWIRDYERREWEAELQAQGKEADYYKENARLTKLKADLAEDKLRESRGELVPLLQLRPLLERIVGGFKNNMLGLGTKIAPELEGKAIQDIRQLIDREVRERLTELANATIRTADLRRLGRIGELDISPGKTSTGTHVKPVVRRKKSHKPRKQSHRIRQVAHEPG